MNKRFIKGMILYAVIFMVIIGAGLAAFWGFIDAYEQSRPLTAVKAYMSTLSEDEMCAGSETLFTQIDGNIQTREQACNVIRDCVSAQISYAKKGSESSSEKQVYVLRDGSQVIGRFVIVPGDEGSFGFQNWTVSETTFDFSYLLSAPVSVTVPSDFSVELNGTVLDDSYITQTDVEYADLEPFYGKYSLPMLVTYEADAFLGALTFSVKDRNGNPVDITEDTDYASFLPQCSDEQESVLRTMIEEFLHAYVIYTGGANGYSAAHNYYILYPYLIPNSDLAARLYTAIDGLQYAQSNRDTIQQASVNHLADLGDDRYYCDVTYIVETWGREGAVQTTNNLKLIILETEDGLKVESMTRY